MSESGSARPRQLTLAAHLEPALRSEQERRRGDEPKDTERRRSTILFAAPEPADVAVHALDRPGLGEQIAVDPLEVALQVLRHVPLLRQPNRPVT